MLLARMQNEVEDLKHKIEELKMRLASEMKVYLIKHNQSNHFHISLSYQEKLSFCHRSSRDQASFSVALLIFQYLFLYQHHF